MSEIQSLARGLKILNMFAESEQSIGITELAHELGIDKSSTSRLVKTLVNYEYVQPEKGSRRYILGKRINSMSWQVLNRMPIRDRAKPFLIDLMNESGECSHTAVYSQGKILVIDDIEAKASLRVVGGVGRRIPTYCTALGKCLLAFSDIPFPKELPAHTRYTITDPDKLHANLEVVYHKGYALDDEENEYGVRCIAAPVYDYSGEAIATIGISGPTVRVTPDRVATLAKMVMQAGEALSQELGYHGNQYPDYPSE